MTDTSNFKSHLLMLAAYHGWANRLLLDEISHMTEADYKAPAGLFFDSVHGTCNHLLLTDRAWLGRFIGKPEKFLSLKQEIEPDRAGLASQLADRHLLWQELIDTASPETMSGSLRYTTMAGNDSVTPWLATITHVFNHATHHRGQISAALTRQQYPCPELDLIYFVRQR